MVNSFADLDRTAYGTLRYSPIGERRPLCLQEQN
jgi:hypothetical protein